MSQQVVSTRRGSKYFSGERLTFILLIGPSFLILFLLTVGPFAYSFLYMSLMDWNLSMPYAKRFFGLGNYVKMMKDEAFWHSIMVTFYQVFGTVIPQIILGLTLALLMAKKLPGIKFWRSVYLLPFMVTPIVVGINFRMLLNPEFGLVNHFFRLAGLPGPNWLGDTYLAMPSIIASDIWRTTPFAALIIIAGIQTLPTDPYEAALIDGASAWQRFRFITLPLLTPVIVLASLFRTIDCFKRFAIIIALTAGGPGNATETLNIYSFNHGFVYLNSGYAASLSIMMILIMLTISLILIRQLRRIENA
jgi:multiple sugar transport system permease protein